MSRFEIVKNIDTYIFTKIDKLQTHPEYQKIADKYANLEENVQEMVKIGLMVILTIIPLLFILIFMRSNSNLNKDLALKEELISVSNELIQKKALISNEEKRILGSIYVDSPEAFKNKFTTLMSLSGVDSNKIKLSNFDTEELDGYITKIRSDINFRDLTSDELFNIMSTVSNKDRIRIDEISVRKSLASGLLEGMMTILYYSKEVVNN